MEIAKAVLGIILLFAGALISWHGYLTFAQCGTSAGPLSSFITSTLGAANSQVCYYSQLIGIVGLVIAVIGIIAISSAISWGMGQAKEDPLAVLELRYAKGRITKKQYLRMKRAIKAASSGSMLEQHHGHHLLQALLVFLVIVLLLDIFVSGGLPSLLPAKGTVQPAASPNPQVTVFGTVTTNGIWTTPQTISFNSQAAFVDANGHYVISLPDNSTFNVAVSWTALGGIYAGSCNAGKLLLFTPSDSYIYNAAC